MRVARSLASLLLLVGVGAAACTPPEPPDPPTTGPLTFESRWVGLADTSGVIGEEHGTASVEVSEFSPDGGYVVTGAKGRMKVNGEWHDPNDPVPPGATVERFGQNAMLWRVADGERIWSLPMDGETEEASFWPGGDVVAVGGEWGGVEVLRWRSSGAVLTTPEVVARIDVGPAVDSVRFSNDGSLLAVGDEDTVLHLYRTSDWQQVSQATHGGWADWMAVNQIDWTDDDRHVVTAGSVGNVKIWEVTTTESDGRITDADLTFVRDLPFAGSVKSVRLSPDDRFVAAGASEGHGTRVWTFDGTVVATIPPHDGAVIEALEFTNDGRYLITGGQEGKTTDGVGALRVYDTEADYAQVQMQPVFRSEYLDFSPTDATALASAHHDGSVRLWRVTPSGSS